MLAGTTPTFSKYWLFRCVCPGTRLEWDHGVDYDAEKIRLDNRLKKMKKVVKTAGRQWSNAYDRVKRFIKRNLKFFSTLRTYFFLDSETWQMAAYLWQLYAKL